MHSSILFFYTQTVQSIISNTALPCPSTLRYSVLLHCITLSSYTALLCPSTLRYSVLLHAGCPPEAFEPLACVPGLEGLQLMRWQDALHAVHRPRSTTMINTGRRQLAFQVGVWGDCVCACVCVCVCASVGEDCVCTEFKYADSI
jgi:hypothetical protein